MSEAEFKEFPQLKIRFFHKNHQNFQIHRHKNSSSHNKPLPKNIIQTSIKSYSAHESHLNSHIPFLIFIIIHSIIFITIPHNPYLRSAKRFLSKPLNEQQFRVFTKKRMHIKNCGRFFQNMLYSFSSDKYVSKSNL